MAKTAKANTERRARILGRRKVLDGFLRNTTYK